MSNPDGGKNRTKTIAVVIPVAIILLPILYSLAGYVFARGPGDPDPFLQMPEERFKYCVEDGEYMRFHHWELLQQVRDEVVREGKSGGVTFDQCRVCHENRAGFCDRCHAAANVRPDCFGCHYFPETPEKETDHE